jgi:V8-like Glu-specific endopeptidase
LRQFLFALALMQSSLGGAAVFGTDDRIAVHERTSVSRAVALALYSDRQATAFLVDSCFAVTSQHLVSTDRNPLGQQVELVLGQERLTARAVRAGHVERSLAAPGYNHDWLLLKLDHCRAGGPVVELAGGAITAPDAIPEAGRKMTAIGYPSDLQRLTVDPDCRIHAVGAYGWLNDCAAQPGSSGGPLVIRHGKRMIAYAIQSGAFPTTRPEAFTADRANLATPVQPIRQALLEERAKLPPVKLAARRWRFPFI